MFNAPCTFVVLNIIVRSKCRTCIECIDVCSEFILPRSVSRSTVCDTVSVIYKDIARNL